MKEMISYLIYFNLLRDQIDSWKFYKVYLMWFEGCVRENVIYIWQILFEQRKNC
jgi:hypothetical protein